jgi:hypothetical protein
MGIKQDHRFGWDSFLPFPPRYCKKKVGKGAKGIAGIAKRDGNTTGGLCRLFECGQCKPPHQFVAAIALKGLRIKGPVRKVAKTHPTSAGRRSVRIDKVIKKDGLYLFRCGLSLGVQEKEIGCKEICFAQKL